MGALRAMGKMAGKSLDEVAEGAAIKAPMGPIEVGTPMKGAMDELSAGGMEPAPATPSMMGAVDEGEQPSAFANKNFDPVSHVQMELDMAKDDFSQSVKEQLLSGNPLEYGSLSANIRSQQYQLRVANSRKPETVKMWEKTADKYPHVDFDLMLDKDELGLWDKSFQQFEEVTGLDAQAMSHYGELRVAYLDPEEYVPTFSKRKDGSLDEVGVGTRTALGEYMERTSTISSRVKDDTTTHLHELFHLLDGQMFAMYHKNNPKYKVQRNSLGEPLSVSRTGKERLSNDSMVSEDLSEVSLPDMRPELRSAWMNLRRTMYTLGNEVKDGSYYERSLAKDAKTTADPYWATDPELLARSFQVYANHKLKGNSKMSPVHPFKRETPELVKAMDKFFKEINVAEEVTLPSGEKGKVLWGVGLGATYSLVPRQQDKQAVSGVEL